MSTRFVSFWRSGLSRFIQWWMSFTLRPGRLLTSVFVFYTNKSLQCHGVRNSAGLNCRDRHRKHWGLRLSRSLGLFFHFIVTVITVCDLALPLDNGLLQYTVFIVHTVAVAWPTRSYQKISHIYRVLCLKFSENYMLFSEIIRCLVKIILCLAKIILCLTKTILCLTKIIHFYQGLSRLSRIMEDNLSLIMGGKLATIMLI